MDNIWGRECKLGWGYNKDLGLLIPVQGGPLNVTSEVRNIKSYDIFSVSSINIQYWVSSSFVH